MQWKHKVALSWMQARQRYLTATEIRSLVPFTKTGRDRSITDDDYMKVMAGKMIELTEDDCYSVGPAARGHLLEPYAVEAYNKWAEKNDKPIMYHWDDIVYPNEEKQIAFSPDGLNVDPTDNNAPTALIEIKSYNADKHLATAYTEKMKLEERWQIAVAFAVEDNIDNAYLVLFNPSMKVRKLFVIEYSRDDLKDEIELVNDIADKWRAFKHRAKEVFNSLPDGADWAPYGKPENEIIAEIYEKQRLERSRLNP